MIVLGMLTCFYLLLILFAILNIRDNAEKAVKLLEQIKSEIGHRARHDEEEDESQLSTDELCRRFRIKLEIAQQTKRRR